MLFFLRAQLSELGFSSVGPIANRKLLQELEVVDLFGDLPCSQLSYGEIRGGGPDGQAGVLVSFPLIGRPLPVARYTPERQSWRQISPAVWIGTDSDPVSGVETIPTPEQLERPNSFGCENVRMADGSIWEVPVLREPVFDGQMLPIEQHETSLPNSFYRDPAGRWRSQVVAEYQSIWNESKEFFVALVEQQSLPTVRFFQFALRVLSLRYRFNVLVHSRWPEQWLNTDTVREVVRASVGWNIITRLMEDQKKTKQTGMLSGTGIGCRDDVQSIV